MIARHLSRIALLAGIALAPACDGIFGLSGDPLEPESSLTFVRFAPDAPPLAYTEVSFWVKRGETREVQIPYLYEGATPKYGKCLLFRVPAEAPLRHADGREFAPGDSALVTIRVTDTSFFRFEFDPSGLQFDPAHPAELEVRHGWADPDHNGDGVVDALDQAIEESFGFWRQERPGEGWERIATTRLHDIREARASVTGFTIYALASN